MDMSGMTTSMSMAPSAAMVTASATSATGGMGGMSMGMGMGMGMGDSSNGEPCKISMLWNWYTVDACFLSETWHVRSSGAFAGSCIGAIALVIALEFLRRLQRETDRAFHRADDEAAARLRRRRLRHSGNGGDGGSSSSSSGGSSRSGAGGGQPGVDKGAGTATKVATSAVDEGYPLDSRHGRDSRVRLLLQQVVRSLLYMMQFAVGYFIMLLAMYYNGYIIICIFIGAFLGAMIFQWDTYSRPSSVESRDTCCT